MPFDWKKSSSHWNIFCDEGQKLKAIKCISRCHGYHETCSYNIEGGVLVKDYSVYKKWINEWRLSCGLALTAIKKS